MSHDLVHECAKLCSDIDRRTLLSFSSSLKWKKAVDISVAYVELTFLFTARNFKLEEVSPPQTFGHLVRFIKRVCDLIFDLSAEKILPGKHERDQSHSCGRALPRGAIFGARPLFSHDELAAFANLILEGGGRTLKTSQFELDMCRV